MKKTYLLLALLASTMPVLASQTTFDFNVITEPTTQTDTSFTVTHEGFTLTVNAPASECFVGGTLRLPLGKTMSVTQKDGRHINMWAVDGHQQGDARIDYWNMVRMGHFGADDSAQVCIKDWGNDYSEFGFNGGDYKTSDGYAYVINFCSVNPSFTFTNRDYGYHSGKWDNSLGGFPNYWVSFSKLTVRDDDVTTGLVDLRGVYHNFWFTISNDIVPIRYCNGVLYCRSIAESATPRVQNTQGLPYGPNQNPNEFTNFDWIALNLTGKVKEWFDAQSEGAFLNHVLRGGTVRGIFCDYAANDANKISFLNPTLNVSQMPEITDEGVQPTSKNRYYVANMNEQTELFYLNFRLICSDNASCKANYL